MAAANASRVLACRVNCNAIGVPGIAASSRMPISRVGRQRKDVNQQEADGRYEHAIRQQRARKQSAVAQDVEQFSAADSQPDGEHHDCDKEIEQRQGRYQHAFLRARLHLQEPLRVQQPRSWVQAGRCCLILRSCLMKSQWRPDLEHDLTRSAPCLARCLALELAFADDGALDGAVPQHFRAVVSADPKCVEAPIELFQHGLAFHGRADAGRRAMNNVDGGSDADLVTFAERQQRLEARRLHPADHVGGGQHRWKLFPPCRQGVLELDALFDFARACRWELVWPCVETIASDRAMSPQAHMRNGTCLCRVPRTSSGYLRR